MCTREQWHGGEAWKGGREFDISSEPNVYSPPGEDAYFVKVAIPFIVLATDMMDAYRQVRDIWEQELIGTAAEDWPFEITVREEQG